LYEEAILVSLFLLEGSKAENMNFSRKKNLMLNFKRQKKPMKKEQKDSHSVADDLAFGEHFLGGYQRQGFFFVILGVGSVNPVQRDCERKHLFSS